MNKVQQRAVDAGIDLERLPCHVAMIMDGNGRFAQKQVSPVYGVIRRDTRRCAALCWIVAI